MSTATRFIIQIHMSKGSSIVNNVKKALCLHVDHHHSPLNTKHQYLISLHHLCLYLS